MESAGQQEQEEQSATQPEQPFANTAAVIAAVSAAGLASASVTVLTPYLFRDDGALVAALMSMFTTAISAFYQGHIVEALNKFAPRLVEASNKFGSRVLLIGAIICLIMIGVVTSVEVVVWILLVGTIICLIVIGAVTGVKAVAWVFGIGAITCLIGIGAVTGVEVGAGKTLPCWIGEKIGLGNVCSGYTQPSIIGGVSTPFPPTPIGFIQYVGGSQYTPIDPVPYYFDADGDGFGAGDPVEYVPGTEPPGWVRWSGDNCPDVANLDQTDSDGDGIGDACSNLIID